MTHSQRVVLQKMLDDVAKNGTWGFDWSIANMGSEVPIDPRAIPHPLQERLAYQEWLDIREETIKTASDNSMPVLFYIIALMLIILAVSPKSSHRVSSSWWFCFMFALGWRYVTFYSLYLLLFFHLFLTSHSSSPTPRSSSYDALSTIDASIAPLVS